MDTISYFINLYNAEIILILGCTSILFLIMILIYGVKLSKWKRKYNNFMKRKEDFDIEDVLQNNIQSINNILQLIKDNNDEIKRLDKHVKLSFQKFGVVKYNAFKELGGQLSFAIALLNQENTGIIINGIHSREGCYIYEKNIVNGESSNVLSPEEKEALQQAINFK